MTRNIPCKDNPLPHDDKNTWKIPFVGWNKITENISWQNTPLCDLKKDEFVYFVHSYYVKPKDDQYILSTTQYNDLVYCSAIHKNNIFGAQFHPEKSAKIGLSIIKNWLKSFYN